MTEYLTVAEAAKRVRASKAFIQARCQDGRLPTVRVGKAYRIDPTDLERLIRSTPLTFPLVKAEAQGDVAAYIEGWHQFMSSVKAYAPDTIITHRKHIRNYIRRLVSRGRSIARVEDFFSRSSLLTVLNTMDGKSYHSKLNTCCALMAFGTYLVELRVIKQAMLDDLKPLRPRQQAEPRRTHLNASDVARFFDVVFTRTPDTQSNLTFAAMVGCMVYAGLRASEVCALDVPDVDLVNNVITVRLGKGGKTRRVGIGKALRSLLADYQRVRPLLGSRFFVQPDGETFHNNKLGKRMKVVSRRLGVDITCHGLRRTFATLASNQGRSVNSIRIALGHSRLETTQQYLRTSEAEVVEQMKDW